MTQRTYNPLLGDIGRYGSGSEHLFFSQAQATPQAAPAAPESTFDRAMRQLGAVADARGPGAQSESWNGMGAPPDVPEGNLADLAALASGLMPDMSTWQGRLGAVGALTGITGAGLAGTAIGRGIDAVRLGNIMTEDGLEDNITMWSTTSPTQQFRDSWRMDTGGLPIGRGFGDTIVDDTEDTQVNVFGETDGGYGGYSPDSGGMAGMGVGSDVGGGSGQVSGEGAPGGYAQGGSVNMAHGGFVVPADVVSGLGDGSTKAGYRRLGIGQLIEGPGTGMSDDIPASIEGRPEAKVADGEVYLSPEEVERVGKGDHAKGLKRLYDLLDFVREARHGTKEQAPPLTLGDAA